MKCEMPKCLCPLGREHWDASTRWHRTTDHIVPRYLGGTDDPTNLRPAHKACNSSAEGQIPHEKRVANGKASAASLTSEELTARGRKGAAAMLTGTTPEERQEWAAAAGRLGGAANTHETLSRAGKARAAQITPEQRHEFAMKAWETKRAKAALSE